MNHWNCSSKLTTRLGNDYFDLDVYDGSYTMYVPVFVRKTKG